MIEMTAITAGALVGALVILCTLAVHSIRRLRRRRLAKKLALLEPGLFADRDQ